jgi:hypothetical protein
VREKRRFSGCCWRKTRTWWYEVHEERLHTANVCLMGRVHEIVPMQLPLGKHTLKIDQLYVFSCVGASFRLWRWFHFFFFHYATPPPPPLRTQRTKASTLLTKASVILCSTWAGAQLGARAPADTQFFSPSAHSHAGY